MAISVERNRLVWRCRRGILELDLLLRGFLEDGYEQMDEDGQGGFVKLLELPDQELFEYLLEQKNPKDGEIASVVEKICRTAKA